MGYNIGTVIGAILVGLILGSILLFYAKRKGVKKSGLYGFCGCLATHVAFGLFVSLPVFIVFFFIIKRTAKKQQQSISSI